MQSRGLIGCCACVCVWESVCVGDEKVADGIRNYFQNEILVYCILCKGGRYSLKIISRYFKNICDDIQWYLWRYTKHMEQRFLGDCSWQAAALLVQTQWRVFSILFQWAIVIDDRLLNLKCNSIVIRCHFFLHSTTHYTNKAQFNLKWISW